MPKLLRSVFRIRPLPALLLSLPALLVVTIYLWRGYSRLDTYRRQSDEKVSISPEMLQIAVYDIVRTDLRRMTMPRRPDNSPLRVLEFDIDRHNWEALERTAHVRGDRPYVNASLIHKGQVNDVELRLRGSKYWNTSLPQKSLKVRLEKGALFDGHRAFNLLNDPTPMVVGEHLILELARELGILTPQSDFARVIVNNKDLGVFHYETHPDESLLRQSDRMPGSIFSGDLPGSAETAELWRDAKRWNKVASKTDSEADKADMSEIERLLTHVRESSFAEFRDFALREIDLRRFALFDALDVAFGGDQHDFRKNHKLYFDPYRGRWEPIAWNFRGFKSDPKFNLVENPILIRLKQVPEYMVLRNYLLHEFLAGLGTPAAMRARATKLLKRLAPDLRTDPYWDAYELLPKVDDFHRRMVRPLDLKTAAMVFEYELTTYRNRHAQLLAELESNPLYVTQGATEQKAPKPMTPVSGEMAPTPPLTYSTPLTVTIDGRAGVEVRALEVAFASTCVEPGFRLWANGESLLDATTSARAELLRPLTLYPSIGIRHRENKNARRSAIRTEVLPVNYSMRLESSCAPNSVILSGKQLATQTRVSSRAANAAQVAAAERAWAPASSVPKLSPGQLSPHPWSLPASEPEQITLGPGDVTVSESLVYGPHQQVTVRPGTKFWLAQKASLIFRGQVHFLGSVNAPIEVRGLAGAAWGGIAVQGSAAEGSRFHHVVASGGTTPVGLSAAYPGMINIHDTKDIVISDARLGNNREISDLIHAAYVTDLRIEDTEIFNTTADAIDLEFSKAKLRRLELVNIGDDGVDFMGADVTVADSLILGAKGNGLSVGEVSRVLVRNSLIADSGTGVLAKNASEVELSSSLLYRNKEGIRVYTRSVRYEGDSEVRASVLYAVESSKRAVTRKDKKNHRLDQGRVFEHLPRPGVADSLLHKFDRLNSWHDLSNWLELRRQEAVL